MPLKRIRAIERELGRETPVLVHTDLVVVDENLRTLAPSFWSYSHLDPDARRPAESAACAERGDWLRDDDQSRVGPRGLSDSVGPLRCTTGGLPWWPRP